MRDIKFRAKNTINGDFVYGYYFQRKGHHYIESMHTIYPVNPPTIGQYTGLKDKNGVEIYEGDIVRGGTYGSKKKSISFVTYEFHSFWIDGESFGYEGEELWDWNNLEVIGNIYEHHHLLEGDLK